MSWNERRLLFLEASSPGLASRVSRLQRLERVSSSEPRRQSPYESRPLASSYRLDARPRLKAARKCLVKLAPVTPTETLSVAEKSSVDSPDFKSPVNSILSPSEQRLVSVLKGLSERKRKRWSHDNEDLAGILEIPATADKKNVGNGQVNSMPKLSKGLRKEDVVDGGRVSENIKNDNKEEEDDNDDEEEDGLQLSSKRARRDTSSSMASSMTMETMPPLFSSNAAIIRETTANLVSRETSDLSLNTLLTSRTSNAQMSSKTRNIKRVADESDSVLASASNKASYSTNKLTADVAKTNLKRSRNAILSSLSTTVNASKRPREYEERSDDDAKEKDLQVKPSSKKSVVCSPDKYEDLEAKSDENNVKPKRAKVMVDKGTDSPVMNRGLLSIPALAHVAFSPRPKDTSKYEETTTSLRNLTPKQVDEGRNLARQRAKELLSVFETDDEVQEPGSSLKENRQNENLIPPNVATTTGGLQQAEETSAIKNTEPNKNTSVDNVDTAKKTINFSFKSAENSGILQTSQEKVHDKNQEVSTASTTLTTTTTASSAPRVSFNFGQSSSQAASTTTTTTSQAPSFSFGQKSDPKPSSDVVSKPSSLTNSFQFGLPKVVEGSTVSSASGSTANQQVGAPESLPSPLLQKSQEEKSTKPTTTTSAQVASLPQFAASTVESKTTTFPTFNFASPTAPPPGPSAATSSLATSSSSTTASGLTASTMTTSSSASGFTFGAKSTQDLTKKTLAFSFGLNTVTTSTEGGSSLPQPQNSSQLGSGFNPDKNKTGTSALTSTTVAATTASSSPFSFSMGSPKSSNMASDVKPGSTNLFGSSTASTTTNAGGNIFSFGSDSKATSSTAISTTTVTASTSGNLFKFGNESSNLGSSVFGNSAPTSQSSPLTFGKANSSTDPVLPNLFAFGAKNEQSAPATTSQQPSSNVFGQQAAPMSSSKTLFGISSNATNASQQSGLGLTKSTDKAQNPSIFGSQGNQSQLQSNNANNMGTNPLPSSSPFVFGNKSSIAASGNAASPSFSFGSNASSTPAKETPKPFAFGTPSQQQNTSATNTFQFGASSNTPTQPALQTSSQLQSSSSPFAFGASQQQQPPAVNTSMTFGNSGNSANSTFNFGSKSSSASATFAAPAPAPSQPIFGSSASNTSNSFSSSTLPNNFTFGAGPNKPDAAPKAPPFAFGATQASSPFGAAPQTMASPPNSSMFSIGSGGNPAAGQKQGRTIARARRTRRP